MASAEVKISVLDLPAFREFMERIKDFIGEYSWHTRDCAAIDADGEWHRGNPFCSCGYDEALVALVQPEVVPRQRLIDLYVKCFDLSEEERDHGLGAVEVTYGERWFPEFLQEVLSALGTVMTKEEDGLAMGRIV